MKTDTNGRVLKGNLGSVAYAHGFAFRDLGDDCVRCVCCDEAEQVWIAIVGGKPEIASTSWTDFYVTKELAWIAFHQARVDKLKEKLAQAERDLEAAKLAQAAEVIK